MDECSYRKGSGLISRNAKIRDQNAQLCSRPGCGGRLSRVKVKENACSEKAKSSRPSFRSSLSGKEIIGSSSRAYSVVRSPQSSVTLRHKKLSSLLEVDSSETSSVHDEAEASELIPPVGKVQLGVCNESRKKSESGRIMLKEVANSSLASNTRSCRNVPKKSGLGFKDNILSSSDLLASKSTGQAACANASRYGLRNLRCNSISDVISSGCSSSDSSVSRRKNLVRKKKCEGESSSSTRGKKMTEPSSEGQYHNSSQGILVSDSRRAKNFPAKRDNEVASVRTRRSISGNTRARFSNQGNGNGLPQNESVVVRPRMSQPEIPIDVNVSSPLHHLSAETYLSRPNSDSRPGSSEFLRSMPGSPTESGLTRSLMSRDFFRHYNMDGIAEVLSALERIEQDEELSYEQLALLETNFFLNGLNLYDQHRDMRLDIDNMSYEELLALEEKMGSVSTALTEEALSKCVKKSIYQSMLPDGATIGCGDKDDVKCSICQEEYVVGDELGRLQCRHKYHVVCINQWLQQKNWCPICKASAANSPSPSSLSSKTDQ